MNDILTLLKTIFALSSLLCLAVFLLFSVIASIIGAPFVPTSRKRIKQMVEMAELQPDDVVFDLGSGDGRLIIEAGKHNVKYAVGFEINPILILLSYLQKKWFRLKNVVFINKPFAHADLSQSNKLFLYLLPSTMSSLQPRILKEMKPGSLIISNLFSFPELEPFRIEDRVYVYKIPEKQNLSV